MTILKVLCVIQTMISTQQRHDSSPPSIDCRRTTSTNCKINTEQTRPRPKETDEHASEFTIQAQGLPAQSPMNYQSAQTTFRAQQTDFASPFAGTLAGEHSGTIGRSNLLKVYMVIFRTMLSIVPMSTLLSKRSFFLRSPSFGARNFVQAQSISILSAAEDGA